LADKVFGEVDRGGMGVVYKATDPTDNRTVAIKMIQGVDRAIV
jgi:serine/threonine protein kinase